MDKTHIKLGILGGGQLGRMLIQKAVDFGIEVSVLDNDPDCPCKNICDNFVRGNINDYETVLNFGQNVDIITIEIEHVNADALEALQKQGKEVYPQPNVIRTVQDKGLQKLFFEKHKIPSSSFFITENRNGLIARSPKFPFVQKLRKSGYDGRGVAIIKSASDFEKTFDAPSVVEEMADIEKEISVIISRNPKGEIAIFPIVELVFDPEANLVDYLFSPASVSEDQKKLAEEISKIIITNLNMVGLLAVEMFVTKTGEILVNEIAPRPHNSGHHTIEANATSQFEQHLRSILNWPAGPVESVKPSVMINLLGEKGFDGEAVYSGMEEVLKMKSVHIHLYGKKFTRAFRKMGHVTILGNTPDEAMQKAKSVRKILKVKSELASESKVVKE